MSDMRSRVILDIRLELVLWMCGWLIQRSWLWIMHELQCWHGLTIIKRSIISSMCTLHSWELLAIRSSQLQYMSWWYLLRS